MSRDITNKYTEAVRQIKEAILQSQQRAASAVNREQLALYYGIDKGVTFHSSRHTFAILTLAAGGDLYTVGKLMGHTNINSTQIYADVIMDTKIDAVKRMSTFFGLG